MAGVGGPTKSRRGRPQGWRKPDAYQRSLMIRLHDAEYAWLSRVGRAERLNMSEVVRRLIYQAKERSDRAARLRKASPP